MRVLVYQDLDSRRLQKPIAKLKAAIAADDFRAASLKKLAPTPFWRAKLDDSNRLLLQFVRYGDETICLFLEVIENHAYEKSRFLRGAHIDADKIEQAPEATAPQVVAPEPGAFRLRWLHPARDRFALLDKPIMFDDIQEQVSRLPPPLVILGPAGSGKTALTLTKLREATGRVLYVTQSAYLAQTARGLYSAYGYENPSQEAEFLSFRELLETIAVPQGTEVTFAAFRPWFDRHRASLKGELRNTDAHALFEEFRGVIGAQPEAPLALPAYQALGVRQSLFAAGGERETIHGLYGRYVTWLQEAKLFDLNLLAQAWREKAEPVYDFAVIDEVQDLTNAQLALILACLKHKGNFLLCGDAHQIVHPNFFSWASVRALFWHGIAGEEAASRAVSVLQANFRNTRAVTTLANTLLKIKQARFGSVDRESAFLVTCASDEAGSVQLRAAKDSVLRDLDARSRASVQHAVIVLRDEDKPAARAHFRTPLIFSVHEAKGLEYRHVILFRLISDNRAAYAELCQDVTKADIEGDTLEYRRARDKADKSLELYKFYVNALYVAMTRAVETLVLVESDTQHPLLSLLGLKEGSDEAAAGAVQTSSKEEWAQEARKLELQGKQEQAQAIRDTFLQFKPVPWSPWSQPAIETLIPRALDKRDPATKLKQTLVDYALWHGQQGFIEELAKETGFHAATGLFYRGFFMDPTRFVLRAADAPRSMAIDIGKENPVLRAVKALRERHLRPYTERSFKAVLADCDIYGVDHRTPTGGTPLMLAAYAGNVALVEALLKRGADADVTDDYGHTAWMTALSRAVADPAFARTGIPALFDLLAPAALDVQTAGRLVRLERHQAEYWLLGLMLASLKTQASQTWARPFPTPEYSYGFFAGGLLATLQELPDHLWREQRRKRPYVLSVLARAEINSNYRPARKLWQRWGQGNYLPAPDMQLRRRAAGGAETWLPLPQALNLPWVIRGTSPQFARFYGKPDIMPATPG